jgi:L-amino acid N-acyltransferase YncA
MLSIRKAIKEDVPAIMEIYVSILARITEGNEHSIYLHTKNGFKVVGVMKSVGVKFDKLLDVTMLQKLL